MFSIFVYINQLQNATHKKILQRKLLLQLEDLHGTVVLSKYEEQDKKAKIRLTE